jgi:glucose/arabinose dehydrogenase
MRRRTSRIEHATSARSLPLALALALALALSACTAGPAPTPSAGPTPQPTTTAPATPTPTPTPLPSAVLPDGAVTPIATGLDAPWSVLRLPNGGVLVSERDTADIVEVGADGSVRTVTHLTEVAPAGEGGLLGLAWRAGDGAGRPDQVYAYFTAAGDNRIVRMPLSGAAGALTLGAPEAVFSGIPNASNHNGGRIAFGPDGMLYVTAGDAGQRDAAQDPASLAGKILRLTPDGAAAPDNPFGTAAWSIGHRNPQGLAWDATGRLWAAEFGQNTWDELNRIERGANYGWPVVEGQAGDPRFSDPVVQWPTSEASPSGLAVIGDTLVVAALRGERIWTVYPAASAGAPVVQPWFVGKFGRIRDVVPGPDGELWFVTNNTDGRGTPAENDDRLLRVPVSPVP